MGVKHAADATPEQWNAAIDKVQVKHVERSAATGAETVQRKPIEETDRVALGAMQTGLRVAKEIRDTFSKDEIAKYVGVFKYPINQWSQFFKNDPKFAQFAQLVGQAKSSAFGEGGKQLTPFEAEVVFGWVPTGREISVSDFMAKLTGVEKRFDNIVDSRLKLATMPRRELYNEYKGAKGKGATGGIDALMGETKQ
jgi:hypothetical protein